MNWVARRFGWHSELVSIAVWAAQSFGHLRLPKRARVSAPGPFVLDSLHGALLLTFPPDMFGSRWRWLISARWGWAVILWGFPAVPYFPAASPAPLLPFCRPNCRARGAAPWVLRAAGTWPHRLGQAELEQGERWLQGLRESWWRRSGASSRMFPNSIPSVGLEQLWGSD